MMLRVASFPTQVTNQPQFKNSSLKKQSHSCNVTNLVFVCSMSKLNYLFFLFFHIPGYSDKGIDQIVDKIKSEKVALQNSESENKPPTTSTDDNVPHGEDISTRVFLR
jgi:hypothetical protein